MSDGVVHLSLPQNLAQKKQPYDNDCLTGLTFDDCCWLLMISDECEWQFFVLFFSEALMSSAQAPPK